MAPRSTERYSFEGFVVDGGMAEVVEEEEEADESDDDAWCAWCGCAVACDEEKRSSMREVSGPALPTVNGALEWNSMPPSSGL